MIKGSYHMSRRNSDYYNRLKRDEQINYSKSWVARLHPELLKPFIKITGATKWNREVFYEIDIERLLKVEEQNKRYREALEFYAERDNYKLEHFDPNLNDYMSTVDYDEGQKARQAIGGEQRND